MLDRGARRLRPGPEGIAPVEPLGMEPKAASLLDGEGDRLAWARRHAMQASGAGDIR
jgi:hypothetical protein